jgi:hypothetical protein
MIITQIQTFLISNLNLTALSYLKVALLTLFDLTSKIIELKKKLFVSIKLFI